MKLIDLSQPITPGMPVYPGDSQPELRQTRLLDRDSYNNFQLTIGMHVGTHVDGPMHLLKQEFMIREASLDRFMGEGCLVDVRGQKEIDVTPQHQQQIKPGSIVLLWSGHDRHYGLESYYKDYPVVSQEFAQLLIDKQVKMLGIDWPSPDHYPFPVHKALLAHGKYIMENLTNLNQLAGHRFEVLAFPLRLEADSSPVRAVARLL